MEKCIAFLHAIEKCPGIAGKLTSLLEKVVTPDQNTKLQFQLSILSSKREMYFSKDILDVSGAACTVPLIEMFEHTSEPKFLCLVRIAC